MKIVGNNRKRLYAWVKMIYEEMVGSQFKFKKGEKGKIKEIFTHFSEALDVRDEEKFDYVLEYFTSYMWEKTSEWLNWDKRSRNNYIGFMLQPENIEVYVAGKKQKNESEIAGTQTEEDWDF